VELQARVMPEEDALFVMSLWIEAGPLRPRLKLEELYRYHTSKVKAKDSLKNLTLVESFDLNSGPLIRRPGALRSRRFSEVDAARCMHSYTEQCNIS
jgi:hypothetical protein